MIDFYRYVTTQGKLHYMQLLRFLASSFTITRLALAVQAGIIECTLPYSTPLFIAASAGGTYGVQVQDVATSQLHVADIAYGIICTLVMMPSRP